MAVLDTDRYLKDMLGEETAKVYATQADVDQHFAHDYCDAYAYGGKEGPRKVFEKASTFGAERLGMNVVEYRKMWEQAAATLSQFWEVPEEFRDTEYLTESEDVF